MGARAGERCEDKAPRAGGGGVVCGVCRRSKDLLGLALQQAGQQRGFSTGHERASVALYDLLHGPGSNVRCRHDTSVEAGAWREPSAERRRAKGGQSRVCERTREECSDVPVSTCVSRDKQRCPVCACP